MDGSWCEVDRMKDLDAMQYVASALYPLLKASCRVNGMV